MKPLHLVLVLTSLGLGACASNAQLTATPNPISPQPSLTPPPSSTSTLTPSTTPTQTHTQTAAATLTPTLAPPPKLVLISIDGLRPDAIFQTSAPNLLALAQSGAYSWQAQTIFPPVTLPAHASMLCGCPVESHNLT